MALCEPTEISEIVQGRTGIHRVYTKVHPPSKNKTWLFSCDCFEEETWFPHKINNNNPNQKHLCSHILKCIAARIIVTHINRDKHCPPWACQLIYQLGNDWITISKAIIKSLTPIPWRDMFNVINPGYGLITFVDTQDYRVEFKNNAWSCSCNRYKILTCPHIQIIKSREEHLQNRRELGINLAQKFLSKIPESSERKYSIMSAQQCP